MKTVAPILEKDWQKQVIELAHVTGWRVAHFRTAMQAGKNGKPRYLTPVAADGKGFPDLVLVRERLVFAELKVGSNRISDEQAQWLAALERAGQEAYVWYPHDLDTVVRILQTRDTGD